MTVDDTTTLAAFGTLIGMLIGVVGYVRSLHADQLAECRTGREACEARSRAQQEQIDALIDGDIERARQKRDTDQVPTVHEPRPRRKRILGLLMLLVSFFLVGCAETGQSRSEQSRNQRELIVEKRQVVTPAVEGQSPQVVTLTTSTERWLDEGTHTRTEDERHTAPDVPAIAAAAVPVLQVAGGGIGIPQALGALGTLAATAGAAWLSQQGRVKRAEKDADEGWSKAEVHQARAEQYARELPPNVPAPRLAGV